MHAAGLIGKLIFATEIREQNIIHMNVHSDIVQCTMYIHSLVHGVISHLSSYSLVSYKEKLTYRVKQNYLSGSHPPRPDLTQNPELNS